MNKTVAAAVVRMKSKTPKVWAWIRNTALGLAPVALAILTLPSYFPAQAEEWAKWVMLASAVLALYAQSRTALTPEELAQRIGEASNNQPQNQDEPRT